MENFNYNNDIHFDDNSCGYLNDLITQLNTCFTDRQKNFFTICSTVYKISNYFDTHYVSKELKSNVYYDKYKLLAKFGFDRPTVSRLIKCYKRFIVELNNDISVSSLYSGFSPSKLFELLALSNDTLIDYIDKKFITPQMSVKEIREKIKALKSGDKKSDTVIEKIDEEKEIPMAYDPKKHYNIDYFDSMSKKQLVNAIWELQKYVEKLIQPKKSTIKKVG